MASTTTPTPQDTAFLLFGQAMPALDADQRLDVVDCLNDGDWDVALTALIAAIDADDIQVDPVLLAGARAYNAASLARA
jgi:hypothetical protein